MSEKKVLIVVTRHEIDITSDLMIIGKKIELNVCLRNRTQNYSNYQ